MRKKARQLGNGWRRIGPVPRDKQKDIDRKFDAACKEVQDLCDRLEQRFERQAMAGLREVAAACEQMEVELAAGNDVDAATLEEKLGKPTNDEEIDTRISRIKAAAAGETGALEDIRGFLPANLKTKRRLCLEMEIAANIDSPEDCREERMQYRVEQLSQSMSGNRTQLSPAELEQLWYSTGAVPAADRDALEERFRHALKALSAS